MVTARRSKAKPEKRYQLRVELADIKPMIWRVVWVEGHMHLLQLHHIIQATMGWTDAHLHDFTIAGTRYSVPRDDDFANDPVIDERTIRLDKVLKPNLTFEYQYDFGDSWIHIVRVEQAKTIDEPYGAAFIEAGARAYPRKMLAAHLATSSSSMTWPLTLAMKKWPRSFNGQARTSTRIASTDALPTRRCLEWLGTAGA